MQFAGKVALITGGASGIGRETAVLFGREGAVVVVSDILVQEGEETVELVRAVGGSATFVHCDVRNRAEVEFLVSRTVALYGSLDCAFNNAGVEGRMAALPEYEEDEWDSIIDTNLKGVWLCMKYEIPQMLKQGGGSIVNAASAGGLVGLTNLGPYCASKGGVVQLTRTAAVDYARYNIRINAVCPGGIVTDMTLRLRQYPQMKRMPKAPIARSGEVKEVAGAVLWLSSEAASYVNGICLPVDGAYTAF